MYIGKHNTTIQTKEDLQIVEYGSFVCTGKRWYLRTTMLAKDFENYYNCKDGLLKKGLVYTDNLSWRRDKTISGGDAMWYYIAKDKYGRLFLWNCTNRNRKKFHYFLMNYSTAKSETEKIMDLDDTTANVWSELTIKVITQQIHIPLTITTNDKRQIINPKLSTDRTKFGIKHKSKRFFGNLCVKAIKNNFDLTFKIERM